MAEWTRSPAADSWGSKSWGEEGWLVGTAPFVGDDGGVSVMR